MPRPKTPLISKRKTLEVALEIVDKEGLDALSIRRLADALGVNGASLYHHFENKDAILVGVTELALADVRTPKVHDEPWQVWMLHNTQRLRKALLAHPNLVPVILARQPLGVGLKELEATAELLQAEGVPIGYVQTLLRAGEVVTLGSVLEETMGRVSDEAVEALRERYPLLHLSTVEPALSPEELFDALSRATINIFAQLIAADQRWAAGRAKALQGATDASAKGSTSKRRTTNATSTVSADPVVTRKSASTKRAAVVKKSVTARKAVAAKPTVAKKSSATKKSAAAKGSGVSKQRVRTQAAPQKGKATRASRS